MRKISRSFAVVFISLLVVVESAWIAVELTDGIFGNSRPVAEIGLIFASIVLVTGISYVVFKISK